MTTTFKTREYKIVQTLPVTALLAGEGITGQFVIEGKNGATRLLQEFSNGVRRTISTTARVEIEYPAAV